MTDIFIYGDIGQPQRDKPRVSASAFLDALAKIPATQKLNVRIHSNGGSVSEASAIFNAIKAHPGGADTQIDGIAASAAAYIAMAGTKVRMAGNAMMMIHNASGTVEGNADEMRRTAGVIDQFNSTLVPAFAHRTGLGAERIGELMKSDHYMTASQARALGFVDEITGDLKLAARLALHLDGSPVDIAKADNMSEPFIISAEDKTFIQNLREFFTGKAAVVDPVAELQSELRARTSELTGARNTVLEIQAARDTALGQVTALTSERDAALAKIETPEAIEAKVSKEVTARLAAAGVAPIKRDPKAGGPGDPASGDKTMSRADFTALAPHAQSAFCRDGGRITA